MAMIIAVLLIMLTNSVVAAERDPRSAVSAYIKDTGDGLIAIVTDVNGKQIPTECEKKMQGAMQLMDIMTLKWAYTLGMNEALLATVDRSTSMTALIAKFDKRTQVLREVLDEIREQCWSKP